MRQHCWSPKPLRPVSPPLGSAEMPWKRRMGVSSLSTDTWWSQVVTQPERLAFPEARQCPQAQFPSGVWPCGVGMESWTLSARKGAVLADILKSSWVSTEIRQQRNSYLNCAQTVCRKESNTIFLMACIDLRSATSPVMNSCYSTQEADVFQAWVLFRSGSLSLNWLFLCQTHLLRVYLWWFFFKSWLFSVGTPECTFFSQLPSQLSWQGHFEEIWTCP